MALRLKDPKKIKHFQKAHGLKVTGKLDHATNRKIRVHNSNAKTSAPSPARSAPKDPLAPAVKSAVRLKFRQPENDLRKQIVGSDVQSQRVGSWYDDYVNAVRGAQQQAQQGYGEASSRLTTEAANADTVDRAGSKELTDQMAADAATRGGSVDPSIAAKAQQAASARRLGIQSMLTQTATQGANANTAMAGRGAVGVGAKANALTSELNRKRALQASLTELRGQKGDYAQQARSALAKDMLNSQIAEQELGIKVGQLGVNQANAKTSRLAARSLSGDRKVDNKREAKKFHEAVRHNQAGEATQAEKNRIARYKAKHPNKAKGPKTGPTRSQRVTAHQQFDKGRALLSANTSTKKGKQSTVVAFLVSKGVPADIALAAYQYSKFGGAGPKTRKVLAHRYGLKVRGFPRHQSSLNPAIDSATSTAGQIVGQ